MGIISQKSTETKGATKDMENYKEELIKMISSIEREDAIKYLFIIVKDVVKEINASE